MNIVYIFTSGMRNTDKYDDMMYTVSALFNVGRRSLRVEFIKEMR